MIISKTVFFTFYITIYHTINILSLPLTPLTAEQELCLKNIRIGFKVTIEQELSVDYVFILRFSALRNLMYDRIKGDARGYFEVIMEQVKPGQEFLIPAAFCHKLAIIKLVGGCSFNDKLFNECFDALKVVFSESNDPKLVAKKIFRATTSNQFDNLNETDFRKQYYEYTKTKIDYDDHMTPWEYCRNKYKSEQPQESDPTRNDPQKRFLPPRGFFEEGSTSHTNINLSLAMNTFQQP